MHVHGHLSGGAPILAKLQIGEALPVAGVPLESGAEDEAGVVLPDLDSSSAMVGISLDAQPDFYTTQRLGNADPAVYVTVSTRPDLIARSRLAGGETPWLPLPEFVNTVASADGSLVTAAFGTEYASGHLFAATGANAGQLRKLGSSGDTDAAPFVPFQYAIAVGDIFYAAAVAPYTTATGAYLTEERSAVNATRSTALAPNFACLGVFFKPKGAGGALDSYVDFAIKNHWIVVGG